MEREKKIAHMHYKLRESLLTVNDSKLKSCCKNKGAYWENWKSDKLQISHK